jgi:hypothetical protein
MEGRLMFKLFSSSDAEVIVPLYETGFNWERFLSGWCNRSVMKRGSVPTFWFDAALDGSDR